MILAGSVQQVMALDELGSTGVAALKQGRCFIGMDYDAAYLQKLAIPKLQQVMGESGAVFSAMKRLP